MDQLLDASQVLMVEQHLATCEFCREEVAALQQLDKKIASAWNQIELPVFSAEQPPAPRIAKNKPTSRSRWLSLSGLAAGVLISLSMIGVLLQIQPKHREAFSNSKIENRPPENKTPELPVAKVKFRGDTMGKPLNKDSEFTVYQVLPTPIENEPFKNEPFN